MPFAKNIEKETFRQNAGDAEEKGKPKEGQPRVRLPRGVQPPTVEEIGGFVVENYSSAAGASVKSASVIRYMPLRCIALPQLESILNVMVSPSPKVKVPTFT